MKGEQTIYDNVFLLKIDVIMKKVESFKYQAPEVKVIVVNLEKGFAASCCADESNS